MTELAINMPQASVMATGVENGLLSEGALIHVTMALSKMGLVKVHVVLMSCNAFRDGT